MQVQHANWNFPTTFWFGNGRIQELAKACEQLNIENPLFVTDEGLVALNITKTALDVLTKSDIAFGFYSNVQGNPSGRNVEDGVMAYKNGQHDGIIAFGGGSALDAAKAIALMVGQNRPLWDFEDVGDNWKRVNKEGIAPVIAIPTTAGTGSEVGRASVITHEGEKLKKIIFHPGMLPKLVIADPELTVELPQNLTAWTGVDALVHAIEAYCAPGYHPMADGIAVEAIKLIFDNLPLAHRDGENLEARGNMLTVSAMAAVAFQKGLGSIHSVSHQLGALYGLQHGLANSVLLPYGIKQNSSALHKKMNYLSTVLALSGKGTELVIDHILKLRSDLNIPHSLNDLGIDLAMKEEIGIRAFNDPSTPTNARPITAEELQQLFVAAVEGDLSLV
ncbi:MAG: iron-containing alcohol dehydrogenase [Cyclobacteriaceae bacterium]